MIVNKTNINTKLAAINELYSTNCINVLDYNRYFTSSEYNNNITYFVSTSDGILGKFNKNYSARVLGMLKF